MKPWLYLRKCLWIYPITFPFISLQDQLKITQNHACAQFCFHSSIRSSWRNWLQTPLSTPASGCWEVFFFFCRVTRCVLSFFWRLGDSLVKDWCNEVFIKASSFHSLSSVNEWWVEELLFLLGTVSCISCSKQKPPTGVMWELLNYWVEIYDTRTHSLILCHKTPPHESSLMDAKVK